MNKNRKVLHVSTAFGTSSAGYRLHKALLQETNIESFCFVQSSNLDDLKVIKFSDGVLSKTKQKIFAKLENILIDKYYPNRSNFPFSTSSFSSSNVIKQINEINPDIVHLHWICGGFLSIEDIAKIKAPIVWSLHDQWAYTGGCHIVAEQVPQHSDNWMSHSCGADKMCSKYKGNCGKCDLLGSKKVKDLSFRILQRKKKSYNKIKSLTPVGLSRWMAKCAFNSSVFAGKKIVNLPNTIDTNMFKPLDKQIARKLWNLPADKKLVLFGAMSATSTLYKGFVELVESLGKIKTQNIEFIVFGSSEPKNPPKFSCEVHYLGHLNDDLTLATIYSACDVMAHPSKRENLSNVIMESLSCGLPVVAFDIGGNADMVTHKTNGYLAQPFNSLDFANGIDWVLNNEHYKKLSGNAREKVLGEFDYKIVAEKYLKLYEEVLSA